MILQEKLFPEATVGNPVDVLATAGAGHFRAALDVMTAEDQIDSLYINFVTPFFADTESIAREIVAVNKQGNKPIICNLMTDKRQWAETLRILVDGGVPCYSYPGTAARALVALTRYRQIRSRETGQVTTFDDVDRNAAKELLQRAAQAGRKFLSTAEAYRLLAAYGIPVAEWRLVDTPDEAEKAAAGIGFPVVIKVDSAAILHKSDVGGVALDLKDRDAVRRVLREMRGAFEASDVRFLVQKYLPGGKEFIAGAKIEEGLGHLLMFGMGGVYVEALRDVVFKLAPITGVEAREMLSSIKLAPLLRAVRGEKGVDQGRIAEIILRVSQLVTDLPSIRELDLNPIVASEDGVSVVDGRIGV
jgi:acetyltransferase